VEFWVFVMTALAALALVAGPVPAWVLPLIGMRISEIIVYKVNVLLYDPERAQERGEIYEWHSYRRSLVLALLNYAEILLWFAASYLALACDFVVKPVDLTPKTPILALYYSVIIMSTLGYGDITPASTLTRSLAMIQTTIGLVLALLIISRMVSLLPKPETRDEREQSGKDCR